MAKVLNEHGGSTNRFVLRLDEYKGRQFVDLRLWFLSKDKEWCRTKKGITLNKDKYKVLKQTIEQNDEEIMTWLGQDFTPEEVTRYDEVVEASAEKAIYASNSLVVDWYNNRRETQFFDISEEGGVSRVSFNKAHPVGAELSSMNEGALVMIASMLLSYSRARTLLEGVPVFDNRTLFRHLEEDWSKFLKDQIRDKDA